MKKVKLEEVSEIYGGYAFKSKDFGVGENFVVKIKDIKPPIIDIENADKVDVTKYSIKKMEKYKVFPDDIVIAMTGATIGKVGRNKSGRILYLNQRVAKITPNIKEDLDFIYYCISNNIFLEYVLNNLDSNSAQGNISHFGIGNFEINWYDRETRQKIAQILSCLDDKIEILHQINDNLTKLAKTIYDYWFVQFDFPDENGKPYKSSGGKMVYNEVLKREIPEGWEVKNLYEIADYINGLACQKYRPTNENNFLPVIKIKEMNEGISSNTEKVRTDIPEKYIIYDGDVLFSWSASLDVKIWIGGKGGLNQHIFKVKSDKFPMSFYFFELKNYLQHFKMMAELRKTTMGHITINHLKDSYISIPTIVLIEKLDIQLRGIIENIVSSKKQIQHLQSLRDWLLPMLINGQISVE